MNVVEKLMLYFGYVKADLLIQEEKDNDIIKLKLKGERVVSFSRLLELEKLEGEYQQLSTKYNKLLKGGKRTDPTKLQNWATQVKQRDSKCQVCGSDENLSAHHLFSKNDYPNVAYELDNGITMCLDCHNKFHKQYPQRCIPKNYEKFKILEQGGFN